MSRLNPEPWTSVSESLDTNVQQPIRIPRNVRTSSEKTGNDEPRKRLVAILERWGYNGRAEREADIALRQFDSPAGVELLIAWTLHATKTDKINNPIAFAISEARKGGNPPFPSSKASPYTMYGLNAAGALVPIPAKAIP
jgi:hypothetical protein